MIASLMLYALAVSVLFGTAGVALERCLRARRRQSRWGIALAMLGWTAIILTAPVMPVRNLLPAVEDMKEPFEAAVGAVGGAGMDLAFLDGPLTVFWIASSLLTLLAVVLAELRLGNLARSSASEVLEGVNVRRSSDFGPAVVGWFRYTIIVPSWFGKLDPESVRLALSHEREHLRAGDQRLLFLGVVLASLQPWNPMAWWVLFRLRRAIEADCDQRVIRSGIDLRKYARLLVALAARRPQRLLKSPVLLGLGSTVGWRVDRMADMMAGNRPRVSTLSGAWAAGLAAIGFLVPAPAALSQSDSPGLMLIRKAVLVVSDSSGRPGEIGSDSLRIYRFDGEEASDLVRALDHPIPTDGQRRILRVILPQGPAGADAVPEETGRGETTALAGLTNPRK